MLCFDKFCLKKKKTMAMKEAYQVTMIKNEDLVHIQNCRNAVSNCDNCHASTFTRYCIL